MKEKNFLQKLIWGYDQLEEKLLCASLVGTTLIIFMQIIMRSFLNSSITWSEELTRYIFIWQIWLGVSIAERENDHIYLEIVNSVVKSETIKRCVKIIANLIMIAFNIFLVVKGAELVQQMITRGNVSGAMRMPMYYVYMALPVSSFILCVRLVAKTLVGIKDLFTKKEGAE